MRTSFFPGPARIKQMHLKRRYAPCLHRDKGFTLIEILLAFFIFGIVAVTVFGAYRSVFSNADALLQIVSDDETGILAVHRMMLDLNSLVVQIPPLYRPALSANAPDPYRFTGEREWRGTRDFSSVRFTSLARAPVHAEAGPAGAVSRIRYFVEASETGDFVLRRASRAYPFYMEDSEEKAYAVCNRVRSFTLTFYDETGTPFERWDSDSPDFRHATPKAVHIRLEVGGNPGARIFETRLHLPLYRESMDG